MGFLEWNSFCCQLREKCSDSRGDSAIIISGFFLSNQLINNFMQNPKNLSTLWFGDVHYSGDANLETSDVSDLISRRFWSLVGFLVA